MYRSLLFLAVLLCAAKPLPAQDWVRAQTRPYPGAFTFHGDEKVVDAEFTEVKDKK